MLQSVLQERVRGNKALSLTGAIGVVEGLLFVVHLWVRCYQLPFFPLLGSFWIPSEVVLTFQYHKVIKIGGCNITKRYR